jgi:hypothetical protein
LARQKAPVRGNTRKIDFENGAGAVGRIARHVGAVRNP